MLFAKLFNFTFGSVSSSWINEMSHKISCPSSTLYVSVKEKGSSGVLDPIDQRQSIGFKINSVGFGSTRPEAIYDYVNIPTQLNV